MCSAAQVHIDWGKLQQDWYKSIDISQVKPEQRRQNYIDFMTQRVDEICPIDEANRERIQKDAREFEEAELFTDDNVSMYQEGGKVYLKKKFL